MNPAPDRLSSMPLRNWFLAWHIHTGDPSEVIAKGFDLPTELVIELIGREAHLVIEMANAIGFCGASVWHPPTSGTLLAWASAGLTLRSSLPGRT